MFVSVMVVLLPLKIKTRPQKRDGRIDPRYHPG
jgi:hypothetical protein